MTAGSDGLGLAFVEIRVADWPIALRWYVEILGLRVIVEDREGQFALLEAGQGRFALKAGGAAGRTNEGVRLVFQVDDLDAKRERLLRLGCDIGAPSENTREGYREFRLRDPDATSLTFFSWLEPSVASSEARKVSG